MAHQLRSPVASASILGLMVLVLVAPALVQGMPGGVEDVPVSDPGVQQAAAFAVQAYNNASNSPFYYKALRIVTARRQVVAGMRYYLTEELVKTQCEKTGGSDLSPEELQRCTAAPPGERQEQTCNFQVLSQPWMEIKMKLTSTQCMA
ncbi:cystatin-like [Elgaria multicarinata webbii]|uniref:cystatin-like n=1 Tax=Elgaria multicarinata webbii TaxID=159646 RepID=UPI002FCCCBDA